MNRRELIRSIVPAALMPHLGMQADAPVPIPAIENWQYGAGSRVTQFQGETVGLAGYGSQISVDLQDIKPQFGVYTMKFSAANYFYSYPGPYEATISIGGKEFCSTYGWAIGEFSEIALICPVSNYFTLYDGFGFDASQDFGISFNAAGWPVYFKDVSLAFVPQG